MPSAGLGDLLPSGGGGDGEEKKNKDGVLRATRTRKIEDSYDGSVETRASLGESERGTDRKHEKEDGSVVPGWIQSFYFLEQHNTF